MRNKGLDVLKTICAFLIVCIHAPFPAEIGEYFTALTRIAVPIFFMITGFYYQREKENRQIIKILKLTISANVLFFGFGLLVSFLKKTQMLYLKQNFSVNSLIKFIVFNDSPFAPHLWYLSSILYVLVIVKFIKPERLYFLIPILLAGDLVLGKYSLLILGREFPYVLVRNFLFVGLPYFLIGYLIRQKDLAHIKKKKLVFATIVFIFTTLLERFILVYLGLNSARDHYLSSTLLAITLFILFYNVSCEHKTLSAFSVVGKRYSTMIYIIHPMIITILSIFVSNVIYQITAPFIVFVLALTTSFCYKKITNKKS